MKSDLFNGIPYKGPVKHLKSTDKDQPVLKYASKACQFDMKNADDVQKYEEIWTKAMDGKVLVGREDINFHNGSYVVFIKYSELYYTLDNNEVDNAG